MYHRFFGLLLLIFLLSFTGFSQKTSPPPTNIKAVSEEDTTPALINALPDAENIRNRAVYIRNTAQLKKALGERNILGLVEFEGGNVGATAQYEAGKLLIFEYATPQASIDADNKFKARLAEPQQNPSVYYRRVGNYAVFVFDGKDEISANSLIDQVKYEKSVRWLGDNPYEEEQYKVAEKKYLLTTANLALSTVLFIVAALLGTVLVGILAGYIFFRIRKQQRANMSAFSDAGGMIRLNLDDLTEVATDRLLNK